MKTLVGDKFEYAVVPDVNAVSARINRNFVIVI